MSKGVMGIDYADGRRNRPELIYRYKFRAFSAFKAVPSIYKGSLIDFGAADGLTLSEIQKIAKLSEVVGIELSTDLVTIARKNGFNVIKGDICNLPSEIPHNHYDAVTALAVLEHLEHPEKAMQEAFKVLKPGGFFIASSPNPIWDDIASKIGIHKEKEHHVNNITPLFFKKLSLENGFKFVKSEPFMLVGPAFLPYLNINPGIKTSYLFDKIFNFGLFKFFYVNQLFIAQKPY